MTDILLDNLYHVEFFGSGYFFNPETVEIIRDEEIDLKKNAKVYCNNEYRDYKKRCEKRKIDSITLILTRACNMSCLYCYGKYGRPKCRESLSLEKIKNLILQHSKEGKPFNICFFGGEPLVEFNKIKQCVEFCEDLRKRKGIRFNYSIVTNATLVNSETCILFDKYDFDVTVSFDGMPAIQNKQRKLINGEDSFKIADRGIQLLEYHGVKFHFRVTITKEFIGQYVENILFIVDRYKRFPSVQLDSTTKWDIDDIHSVERQLNELVDQYIEGKCYDKLLSLPKVYAYFEMLLKKKKDYVICEAGISNVCVSPDDNYYLCHRFDGNPVGILGNIEQELDYNNLKAWKKINRCDVYECKCCFARYFCGFGCPSKQDYAPDRPNNTNKIFCEFEKIHAKLALKYYIFFSKFEPEYLNKLMEKFENVDFEDTLSISISKLRSELIADIVGQQ